MGSAPAAPWVPAQPSPEVPPTPVHDCAPSTLQLKVTVSPSAGPVLSTVTVMGTRPKPVTDIRPVLSGSRTDCNVTLPVVLVVSAVEVQTLERAVYCAATLLSVAAANGVTGQYPAEPTPSTRFARLPLPTTLLFESNRAPPEEPAPTSP